jgi:hypothetical protein
MKLLYDKLAKLRLLAAVLYDQGTAADLTEEQKHESIAPLQQQRDWLIKYAVHDDFEEAIIAIKNIEEDAALEKKRADRFMEKYREAMLHAQHIREALKSDMIAHGHLDRIHGNYMATITDGSLQIR